MKTNPALHKALSPYFLLGPTAVGKTTVAQFIAQEQGWDILSADSMLIYRGMNIGTAKPSPLERGDVNYFGVDLVNPDAVFNVWQYREYCSNIVAKLSDCIVAGGTGLYVQSLLGGLTELPGANAGLRSRWDAKVESDGIESLQSYMQSHCPDAYEAVQDKKNARRLIRALEVFDGGVVDQRRDWAEIPFRIPGLMMPQDNLNKRIESRVDEMFEQGLVEEVRALMGKYKLLSTTAQQAIGYSETIAYINGDSSMDAAREKVKTRTRRLAKRQMTWFRNQMKVDWIEISAGMEVSDIAGLVLMYWNNNGPAQIVTK